MTFSAIALTALILSTIALCLCIIVFVELRAMQKSTHQVQYVPIDDPEDVEEAEEDLLVPTKDKVDPKRREDEDYLI